MDQNTTFFASIDMNANLPKTHTILVRECSGNRSSKSFSINARNYHSEQILNEIKSFNEAYLCKKLEPNLILFNEKNKNKTHLVTVIPRDKLHDSEKGVSLNYPHYSCLDVALQIQMFLCHGKVDLK